MSLWSYPLLIMFPLFLCKVSPYDSSDCIICSSGYNHDINNVSSIFLVKSALMHDDYTH
jgi:hypothetical protein